MKSVRLGIIGMGNMGTVHARNILEGKVSRVELVAVSDRNKDKLAPFAPAKAFTDVREFLASDIDAVLIVTPHFEHTSLGIAALEAGKHVLVEKPISVHKADAVKLLAAHKNPKQVFAAMFNQRTDPRYRKTARVDSLGRTGRGAASQLDHHRLVSGTGLLQLGRLAGDMGRGRRRRAA